MGRGGYRPNSGPMKGTKYKTKNKKQPKTKVKKDITPDETKDSGIPTESLTPLECMLQIMNDKTVAIDVRARVAIAAAPFIHGKPETGKKGKKDEKDDKAKKAGQGKFASMSNKLRVVK